jgi:hypothetical protein
MAKRSKDLNAGSILHEDDPELEREYRMLAQLLIDIYLWKRERKPKLNPQDEIDKAS